MMMAGAWVGLLTVVRQYLLAGTADLGPVRLQTAQNPQHVIRIDCPAPSAKRRAVAAEANAARPQLLLPARTSSRGQIFGSSSPSGHSARESRQLIPQIFVAAERQGRVSPCISDFRLERDKFAGTSRKRRLTNPDTAKRCLFKQKQWIVVGESAPRVVRVLTSFGPLLYDPDAQNGALGGS
jgi:hypothetical protein